MSVNDDVRVLNNGFEALAFSLRKLTDDAEVMSALDECMGKMKVRLGRLADLAFRYESVSK